ncbi:hypothetical protein [Bdellovibrio sp. HCB-110]|uniref:hypothetical protein n=1 Tax=Bdellovibrio TaxID=958 RepID=UPI0039B62384
MNDTTPKANPKLSFATDDAGTAWKNTFFATIVKKSRGHFRPRKLNPQVRTSEAD